MKLRPLLLAALAFTAARFARADSIVVGGGCFWCMDAAYKLLPGVTHITCGYAGGHVAHPSYEEVCTETTGHAEVVKVDYDPAQVSLDKVLDYFYESHDPTQVGGQGNDTGPSYRSIILYANDAQKAAALKAKEAAHQLYEAPITTEIVPLQKFWPAEDYHQDYFAKHPDRAYCSIVIRPKVEHLRQMLKDQGTKPSS